MIQGYAKVLRMAIVIKNISVEYYVELSVAKFVVDVEIGRLSFATVIF